MSDNKSDDLKLYQVPIDALPINVAVYRKQEDDFIIIDFNKAAEISEDIKKELVIGKELTDIFPTIKEFGLFEVLERVSESGIQETFNLKFYKDKRISGWRKNEVIKLPNGDIMAIYEDLTKEKQLQETLNMVYSFIDSSQTIVFFWKAEEHWPVEYVSNNVNDWGYSKDDFLSGKINYEDVIYRDDLKRVSKEVERYTKNNNNRYTQIYRIVTANGSIRWVDDRTIIERNSVGEVIHYLGTIIDITEQKSAENKLELLGKIVNNSINEIYIVAKDNFKFTYVNKSAVDNLGYTQEEMLNMSPTDIKPYFAKHKFKKLLAPLLDGSKQEITSDTVNLRKDGTTYNIESHVELMNIEGIEHFVVIALDTTERKKIDLELKQSEEQFRTIAESSLIGIFIYKDKFVYVNQALIDMSGYTRKELLEMKPWELADKSVQEEMRIIMSRRLSGEQFPHAYDDLALASKSGEVKITRLMTETIKYKNGYAGLGSIVDITDVKETKRKLKILAQAIEQTDELVMITDADGMIVYINDAYIAHSGYKHHELIGQYTQILKSGHHNKEFYKNLWDTISSGGTYNNTIVNMKKDGQIYYNEVTITPIFDEKKVIINYVATGRDITPRIEMEKKLKLRATTDELTKIYNRYYGNEIIDVEVNRAIRYGSSFAVLMFDIDHFKLVNDTYGHDVGNIVLKKLSKVISIHMRKSDTFIRWGGEEFLIISAHLDKNEAMKFAQKLRVAIESYEFDLDLHITISIGVAISKIGDTKESILKRADEALYQAKEDGRNCIKFI